MYYKKSTLGQTTFQTRSASLTRRQRSMFILFDGKRSVADVLAATAGLGVVSDDVALLMAMGMLEPMGDTVPSALGQEDPSAEAITDFPTAPLAAIHNGEPTALDKAHYSRAYPIATRLTAALGLRGFRLNLAVKAAGDLSKLQELAPKIKEAVGAEKFGELAQALYD